MNLEYFISSLPMLLEDQAAKIGPEEFLALCDGQLSSDLSAAAHMMLGDGGRQGSAATHPFVLAWRDREAQLRNAIAAERHRKHPEVAATSPRETASCDPSIAQGVTAAFAAKDPLSRELALDSIRWRVLGELQGIAPFSEAAVLAYAGRLAINARRFAINEEGGLAKFKELTKTE